MTCNCESPFVVGPSDAKCSWNCDHLIREEEQCGLGAFRYMGITFHWKSVNLIICHLAVKISTMTITAAMAVTEVELSRLSC